MTARTAEARPLRPTVYVRVDSIGHAGLSAEQVMNALVLVMTELAAAEALCLVHGRERGMARYFEFGGCIRFTAWGDPYVPVDQYPRWRSR